MSLLQLSRSSRPALFCTTRIRLSFLSDRLYSSAANSEAVSTTSSTSVHNAAATTPLYTFQDLSEQQVLFAEMRYHNVSWTTIGEYFGISSVEAFFGYIPIATKAHKHQWISRMTEQDMVEHLSSKRS